MITSSSSSDSHASDKYFYATKDGSLCPYSPKIRKQLWIVSLDKAWQGVHQSAWAECSLLHDELGLCWTQVARPASWLQDGLRRRLSKVERVLDLGREVLGASEKRTCMPSYSVRCEAAVGPVALDHQASSSDNTC